MEAQPNGVIPGKKWLVTLVCTGAFVILGGSLLPRMISLPPMPEAADNTKAAAPATTTDANRGPARSEASSTALADKLEPVVFVLGFVALLAFGAAWYIRKRRASRQPTLPKIMRLTAALPMRFNCSAYLVEIGGRNLLVGVDPMGIKTVIPIPSATGELPEQAEPNEAPMVRVGKELKLLREGVSA